MTHNTGEYSSASTFDFGYEPMERGTVNWGEQYPLIPYELKAAVSPSNPDLWPEGERHLSSPIKMRFMTPRGDSVEVYCRPLSLHEFADGVTEDTAPFGAKVIGRMGASGKPEYADFSMVIDAYAYDILPDQASELGILVSAGEWSQPLSVEIDDYSNTPSGIARVFGEKVLPIEMISQLNVSFYDRDFPEPE